ncbi:hypothetical protein DMI62_11820 [Escherichia coli]|nr:hypothetical protein [Escherichia coli]
MPGKEMPDLSAFQLEGCRAGVCAAQAQAAFRALKGNAFTRYYAK